MDHEANHPVRTSEKTLGLVRELHGRDGARIHELEAALDMTKGAIHNHLSTLREHGFVRKDAEEYRLSLALLTLGGHVRSRYDVYTYGRPKADQLAETTGLLVNLMTEEGGQGVYLYQSRGDNAVNLYTHVGYRFKLHSTALGKAILGHMPADTVEEIIDEHGLPAATENTITDRETLFAELETVREEGYATEQEEIADGVACIAAPIEVADELLGAISVSAPTRRFGTTGFVDEIGGEVLGTANEIALDIQYK